MEKPTKISVMSDVEIGGVKYIQVLIEQPKSNAELLELPVSSTGNSYNYANTRDAVGHLTVQVNAYVRKETMTGLKQLKDSDEARLRIAEQQAQIDSLKELATVAQDPDFQKLLAQFKAGKTKAGK